MAPFQALFAKFLKSNSVIRTDIPLLSRSGQRPLSYFSGTIDQSMSPLNIVTNQTYTGAIFNGKPTPSPQRTQSNSLELTAVMFSKETIASNDMDELIDVMAKRRLAIKKLEVSSQRI